LFSCFSYAFVAACHGSPETQNIEDALAHTQSGEPLARGAAEQMSTVREYGPVAHRLSVVRLLPRTTGIDPRKQIAVAVALWATPNVGQSTPRFAQQSDYNFRFAFDG